MDRDGGTEEGLGCGKGATEDSLDRLYNSKLSACGTGFMPRGRSSLVSAVM